MPPKNWVAVELKFLCCKEGALKPVAIAPLKFKPLPALILVANL